MEVIQRIINRLQMMVGKFRVDSVDDSGEIQLIKGDGLEGEVIEGIERVQNYGLSSNVPSGGEALVLFLGGNRDHGVAVAVDCGNCRINALQSGEVVVYSEHGQTVLLDKDGNIKIDAPEKVIFQGGGDNAVKFSELKSGFDTLRDDFNNFVNTTFNAHTHVGAAPGSPTAVPVPVGTPSTSSVDASKVENVEVP